MLQAVFRDAGMPADYTTGADGPRWPFVLRDTESGLEVLVDVWSKSVCGGWASEALHIAPDPDDPTGLAHLTLVAVE